MSLFSLVFILWIGTRDVIQLEIAQSWVHGGDHKIIGAYVMNKHHKRKFSSGSACTYNRYTLCTFVYMYDVSALLIKVNPLIS